MDLLCCERTTVIRAHADPNLIQDDRVLNNLLQTEEKYILSNSYFKCTQSEIKPYMREILGKWMLEVCEDHKCEDQVFLLAMNYVDRFLSVVSIRKSQLQLLGAVCVFLASKLGESRPISAEKICRYTDNSITLNELMGWEVLVLSKLKWDLCAISALDFVDLLLHRINTTEHKDVLRRHTHTFITLCALDHNFSMQPPSMVACASLGAAFQGIPTTDSTSLSQLLHKLHLITSIEVDCMRSCLEQIEQMVSDRWRHAQLVLPIDPESKLVERQTVETPTDVQDIEF